MSIDLSKIAGDVKKCWWFNPKNGSLQFIGEFDGNKTVEFTVDAAYNAGNDRVLIAIDKSKTFPETNSPDVEKLYRK